MSNMKAAGERQKFWFEYVTTPTSDTPGTSLLLYFDNRRYFFGSIAEGLQRACIQRGVGIKKVRNLFLTGRTQWSQTGGMIGLILTMADVQSGERDMTTGKRPNLRIYGGPKLTHSMACARRFVFRTGMPLSIDEAKVDGRTPIWEPQYQDENVNVWSIPVRRGSQVASDNYLPNGRSASPNTVNREQALREKTVTEMFDSDWRKDRLFEVPFGEIKLPAWIWTRDPTTKALNQTRITAAEDAPHLNPDSLVLVRNPWPAALLEELPPADNLSEAIAMSYIARGQPQRGKFLPRKAKELGVKQGPNYAILSSGKEVTLEDGRVITPDMVLEPTDAGRGMAILDIPSEDYLDDLVTKLSILQEHEVLTGVGIISWSLGPGVYTSNKFKDVVNSMADLEHLVSSPETNVDYVAFDSSVASSARLSKINPSCFPVPRQGTAASSSLSVSFAENVRLHAPQRGVRAHLLPAPRIDTSGVPPILDIQKEIEAYDGILQDLLPPIESSEKSVPFGDVEIITIGTGSAVPSKYRNVSATLVRIPGHGSYLFDCGEGTLGQLRRIYTADELDEILCDLRMIWISHLHADHHLGIASVILARHEAKLRHGTEFSSASLYVISEPNMADYLRDYSSVEYLPDCVLLSVLDSQIKENGNPFSLRDTPLPVKVIQTTRVSHCHGAQAIAVTFANGFKFSYSGDCRPSSLFAQIGRESDVLLHEATFDDGMEGDATAKKHCTTGEALGVAAAMKAKNVILTHFSQRYQKIPVLNNMTSADQMKFEEGDDAEIDAEETANDATQLGASTMAQNDSAGLPPDTKTTSSALLQAAKSMNICVAFDLMRIKVRQIPDMYHYYPAIERMFELEHEKSEQKREDAAIAMGHAPKKASPSSTKEQLYEKINRRKLTKDVTINAGNTGAETQP